MPSEFPKSYRVDELTEIARTLDRPSLSPLSVHCLQEALTGYQWAALMDHHKGAKSALFDTNTERRRKLKTLAGLIRLNAPADRINDIMDDLDAPTSHLLGPVLRSDRRSLLEAAERALAQIKDRLTPRRARRIFIKDLALIFALATGRKPGRSAHDGEGGQFTAFVETALAPLGQPVGGSAMPDTCAGDIKAALHEISLRSGRKSRERNNAQIVL